MKYHNPDVQWFLRNNLPMDEFMKGNFSQGELLVTTFRTFIAECLHEVKEQMRHDGRDTKDEEAIKGALDRKLSRRNHLDESTDDRNIETMFIEGITSHQILNKDIPLGKKKKMILCFQDKVGLFDYIALKYEHAENYQRKYFDDLWTNFSLEKHKEDLSKPEFASLGKYIYMIMSPEERAHISTLPGNPLRARIENEMRIFERNGILFPRIIYDALVKEIPPQRMYQTRGGKKRRTDIHYNSRAA